MSEQLRERERQRVMCTVLEDRRERDIEIDLDVHQLTALEDRVTHPSEISALIVTDE